MTHISWQSKGFGDVAPYLASLDGVDRDYGFRRRWLSRSWHREGESEYGEWILTGASFSGDIEQGTLLEVRRSARAIHGWASVVQYHIVTPSGLRNITRDQARRLVNLLPAQRIEKMALRALVEGR
jgi:hypothetical protein